MQYNQLDLPLGQLVDHTILVLVMKGGTRAVSSPEVLVLQRTVPILCFCKGAPTSQSPIQDAISWDRNRSDVGSSGQRGAPASV